MWQRQWSYYYCFASEPRQLRCLLFFVSQRSHSIFHAGLSLAAVYLSASRELGLWGRDTMPVSAESSKGCTSFLPIHKTSCWPLHWWHDVIQCLQPVAGTPGAIHTGPAMPVKGLEHSVVWTMRRLLPPSERQTERSPLPKIKEESHHLPAVWVWMAQCTVPPVTACSEWRPQQGEALQQVWATRQATLIAELWSPVEPVGLQVLSGSSSFPGRKSQSASLSSTGPRACLMPWLQNTWKTTLGL